MCAKCDEIDAKIIRFERLASQLSDKILSGEMADLIGKLLAEKALLHPESKRD